ncbi:carbohydrate porin [Bradyrhizobium sp. CCBAU 051011]|uniref:carbohydrate porin n=1 Tax=Bradyrhizobium sp. CCBAU 051011 TaxID=858422 RepID=UPI00137456DE|nr:carbohydrate porin [Bradyrhizobium sp. CCBAU 051011]QHO78004.1 carbohydrate porin [Bradyrhizobium sp. CCBAU 051011]
MHGYFVVATAVTDVFSFRSTTKQRGLALALSLAASLVGSPAPAQKANGLKPERNIPDEVAKRGIERDSDSATEFQTRQLKRATRLVSSSALAQNSSVPAAKRGSADEIAKNRTQKEIDPFAKFENLREKGMWLNIPGPADTIDQDKAGVRSALADVGIGYVGGTVVSVIDNQLPNAARATTANQLYMGQNPTFSTVSFMIVTYDLSRFGIPDGQIIVGAEQQYWTWKPGGPDRAGLNTLAYYQTFFDRKLELKIGYLRNVNEFAGTLVGGNAGASVLAPSSNILYQAGMSNNAAPTPALNVKYNFNDHLYDKVSIQRSISPDGQYAQIIENPTGLSWSTANTGILLLDEVGYKNKAAPGVPETWLRAGAGFNNSSYKNLQYPQQSRAEANSVYYVAADRQLWQADVQGSASRGIYGGFSVMCAPPDLNKVSQYYELRLYAKGLFDSRPSDQIAIVATNTVWSNFAVDAALAKGNLVHRDSTAILGTYTAHLTPGIYASVGLAYINNPTSITHTRQTGHALNLLVSTSIFF